MPDNIHRDLSVYRLEKSEKVLKDAKNNYDFGSYDTAANRAYYSVFHAMRAVFALDKKDYSKHSAVISFFSKDYILTGKFDRSFGKTIKMAGALRNASDYNDYQETSEEEVREIIDKASEFYEAVKNHINAQIEPDKDNT